VPLRESFLQHLLDMEARHQDLPCGHCKLEKSEGLFRCSDCIGDSTSCHACLLERHQLLPFHRIQMWNGKHFTKTTLHDQGYVLHLGHHGGVCPKIDDPWVDINSNIPIPEDQDPPQHISGNKDRAVNVVHTTGVFKHKVRWCQCPNQPHETVQLFQMRLFPASHIHPETAFTFDVLDHFHIDAMECKTAAASFSKKLCRLTNNVFPDTVPVILDLSWHVMPI
jgi:hypothetical protein